MMPNNSPHPPIRLVPLEEAPPDVGQELADIRAQLASLEHRFVSLGIGFFGIAGIMIWSKLMGWI